MYRSYYVLQQFSMYRNLVHGFSTRALGDMEFSRNDHRNAQSRLKFVQSLAVPPDRVVKMEQIHGTHIAHVGVEEVASVDGVKTVLGADGLLTRERNVFLFAKTADCLPILYFDAHERVVGLAHAGWRGVVGKLPLMMVLEMMTKYGSKPENIVVGVGPCLDKSAQVVDGPIIQQQLPEWRGFWTVEGDKVRVDVLGFAIRQLEQAGVSSANIDVGGICTAWNTEDFFSASQGDDGRFGTIIGMRGPEEMG